MQRDFYNTGKHDSLKFKRQALFRIKNSILTHKGNICKALYRDLGKSPFESINSEINPIIIEIDFLLNRLKKERAAQNGLGNVLLFMPHTLPMLTTLREIIACIYSGNCIMLMTNPKVLHTSYIIQDIIKEALFKKYVFVFNPNFDSKRLLPLEFDYIYHIDKDTNPNPIYIDKDVNLYEAVENLVFSKSIDCGQRYNSPDTIYVNKDILGTFISTLSESIEKQIGSDPLIGEDYCKIADLSEYNRLVNMINMDNVIYGGAKSQKALKIGPHVILHPDNKALITNAIQGPLYPIVPVSLKRGIEHIKKLPANNIYIFTKNKGTVTLFKNIFQNTNICVNSAFPDFDITERAKRYRHS